MSIHCGSVLTTGRTIGRSTSTTSLRPILTLGTRRTSHPLNHEPEGRISVDDLAALGFNASHEVLEHLLRGRGRRSLSGLR